MDKRAKALDQAARAHRESEGGGMDPWETYSDENKLYHLHEAGQIVDAYLAELGDPLERIAELEAKLAIAEDRAAGWNAQAASAQDELEAQLERREDQVVGYQQSLSQANARNAELEADGKRLSADVRGYMDDYRRATRRIAELVTELETVRADYAERDQVVNDYAELRRVHAVLEDQSGRQAARIRNLETQVQNLRYLND